MARRIWLFRIGIAASAKCCGMTAVETSPVPRPSGMASRPRVRSQRLTSMGMASLISVVGDEARARSFTETTEAEVLGTCSIGRKRACPIRHGHRRSRPDGSRTSFSVMRSMRLDLLERGQDAVPRVSMERRPGRRLWHRPCRSRWRRMARYRRCSVRCTQCRMVQPCAGSGHALIWLLYAVSGIHFLFAQDGGGSGGRGEGRRNLRRRLRASRATGLRRDTPLAPSGHRARPRPPGLHTHNPRSLPRPRPF